MTETIAGLPFWQISFDADGDPEGTASEVTQQIIGQGITDLLMFSHGWNNSPATARRLYSGWFGQLAPQLAHATTARPVNVGLVGVFWQIGRAHV